jgi:hypothetical protein
VADLKAAAAGKEPTQTIDGGNREPDFVSSGLSRVWKGG